jgi:hypothetical protein
MTDQEKNQPFSTFLKAGYGAFRMAAGNGYFGLEGKVLSILNPYSLSPYTALWQRGWDRGKADYERGKPSNPGQFVDNRQVSDYAKERQQRQQTKQQAQDRFKKQRQGGKSAPRTTHSPKPLTSGTAEWLTDKLNKKYRTVV